jgi:ribosomal protein L7/L12
MAEDFTNINEGAYIIAESIIESAKIYAETLRHAADEIEQLFLQTKKESIEAIRELQAIKKQFEEQKKKYEDELAALNAIIKQKTEEELQETPSAPVTPVTPDAPASPAAPAVKYASLLEEIRITSEEQRKAKMERNMKKFKGTRKYATERMAQIAVARYSKELRAMWAALASILGRNFSLIERNPKKLDPHPIYSIISRINEYRTKYGYAALSAPSQSQQPKPRPQPVTRPKPQTTTRPKPQTATRPSTIPVTYGVRIENASQNKLQLIKIYKEMSGLGLKEAKETIEKAPIIIPNGLTKEEAEKIVSEFVKNGFLASIIIADA